MSRLTELAKAISLGFIVVIAIIFLIPCAIADILNGGDDED